MYSHYKLSSIFTAPKKVVSLPGDLLDKATIADIEEQENTPFRDAEDLKHQYFGPSVLNKQRLLEIGDSLLYQGAYAAPGAGVGALAAGPLGAFTGIAVGKLLGQAHYLSKEQDRFNEAKKQFSPTERNLLKKINKSYTNWALGSGLLGALGAGGLAYATGQDRLGTHMTPILEGLAGGGLAAIAGGMYGHHRAKEKAKADPATARIIAKYDHF